MAFLRAIAEAAGLSVHVYTSPHLVRFAEERIRLTGRLIDDERSIALANARPRRRPSNAGKPITFFEVTTAVALVAFRADPRRSVHPGGRGPRRHRSTPPTSWANFRAHRGDRSRRHRPPRIPPRRHGRTDRQPRRPASSSAARPASSAARAKRRCEVVEAPANLAWRAAPPSWAATSTPSPSATA